MLTSTDFPGTIIQFAYIGISVDYTLDDFETVFFRHKTAGSEEELRQLWENNQVALHWGQNDSINYEDYEDSTAQNEIRRLSEYGEEGIIVAAYYGNQYDIHSDEMLIGVIPPGTTPEITTFDKTKFKTLQIDEKTVTSVSFKNYPVLSALRPRGHSLCRWPAAGDQIRTILAEGQLPAEVGSLSPSQLEVACNEYLRVRYNGYFPTLPVGRTLRDVDIVGGTGSNRILSQVTQESDTDELESKLDSLREYHAEDTELLFFGNSDMEPDELEYIHYVTVEEVFDTLYSDEEQGRKMLDRMLNPVN